MSNNRVYQVNLTEEHLGHLELAAATLGLRKTDRKIYVTDDGSRPCLLELKATDCKHTIGLVAGRSGTFNFAADFYGVGIKLQERVGPEFGKLVQKVNEGVIRNRLYDNGARDITTETLKDGRVRLLADY